MAEVIWGLATSHVPSIGAAMDRQKTEDPNWKDLFDGYAPGPNFKKKTTAEIAGEIREAGKPDGGKGSKPKCEPG